MFLQKVNKRKMFSILNLHLIAQTTCQTRHVSIIGHLLYVHLSCSGMQLATDRPGYIFQTLKTWNCIIVVQAPQVSNACHAFPVCSLAGALTE